MLFFRRVNTFLEESGVQWRVSADCFGPCGGDDRVTMVPLMSWLFAFAPLSCTDRLFAATALQFFVGRNVGALGGQTSLLPLFAFHAGLLVGCSYIDLARFVGARFDLTRSVAPLSLVHPSGEIVRMETEADLLVALRRYRDVLRVERHLRPESVDAFAAAICTARIVSDEDVVALVQSPVSIFSWTSALLSRAIRDGNDSLVELLLGLPPSEHTELDDDWLISLARVLHRAPGIDGQAGPTLEAGEVERCSRAIVRGRWELLKRDAWKWLSSAWDGLLLMVCMTTVSTLVPTSSCEVTIDGDFSILTHILCNIVAGFWIMLRAASRQASDGPVVVLLLFALSVIIVHLESDAWFDLGSAGVASLLATAASVFLTFRGITGPLFLAHPDDRTRPFSMRLTAAACVALAHFVTRGVALSIVFAARSVACQLGDTSGSGFLLVRASVLTLTTMMVTGPALSHLSTSFLWLTSSSDVAGWSLAHRCTPGCTHSVHRLLGEPNLPPSSTQPWLPVEIGEWLVSLGAFATLLSVQSMLALPWSTSHWCSWLAFCFTVLLYFEALETAEEVDRAMKRLKQWLSVDGHPANRGGRILALLVAPMCTLAYPFATSYARHAYPRSVATSLFITLAEVIGMSVGSFLVARKRRTLAADRFEARWLVGPGGRVAVGALLGATVVHALAFARASPLVHHLFPRTMWPSLAAIFALVALTVVVGRVVDQWWRERQRPPTPPSFHPCLCCGSQDSAALLLPCTHTVLCQPCSKRETTCPECTTEANEVMPLHR